MKPQAFLFACLLLPLSSQALQTTRWTIRESEPQGRVRVRIIEGATGRATDGTSLMQDVVFDQTMPASDAAQVDADHVTLAPFVQPRAGQPLWVPVKNAWTPADEDAYSAWFAANANADFLSGTDIIVDCADTGLLFRWVYARNTRMPIANTLSGSGRVFGHFSSNADWDALPTDPDWKKDERFKAALRYLFANTYTGTVENDLAPVAVTTSYVRPGAMFMIIRPTSGHTQSIVAIDPNEGPKTLWGNEPASQLIEETPLLVEVNDKNKQTLGVWREPELTNNGWQLLAATAMPGYSLQQYQQKFQDSSEFTLWLDDQIGVHLTNFNKLQMLSQSFEVGLSLRLDVAAKAYFVCVLHPTQCAPGSQNYNDYSTNSRDARLVDLGKQIATLVQQIGPNDTDLQTWESEFSGRASFILGTDLTIMKVMLDPSTVAKWNPDPRVSFANRWGLVDISSTDINFDFFMRTSMLTVFATDRELAMFDPTPQDTSVFDSEARQLFSKIQSDRSVATFNTASFDTVFKSFEQRLMYVPDAPAVTGCDQGACTMNAVVWGEDGKSDVLDKWSSKSNDSSALRWGL